MTSLREYYLTIGNALVVANGNQIQFRQAVVFLPVEILETYLHDLLTPRVTNETLFIKPESLCASSLIWIPLALIALALVITTSAGLISPLYLTAIMGMTLACVSGALVYYSLAQGMLRRMKFSRMVNIEIIRRRGNDGATNRILTQPPQSYPRSAGLVH